MAEQVRRELARIDKRTGLSQEELILRAHIALAKRGNVQAAAWLWDRGFGRVTQEVRVDSAQTVKFVPWLPATLTPAKVAQTADAVDSLALDADVDGDDERRAPIGGSLGQGWLTLLRQHGRLRPF